MVNAQSVPRARYWCGSYTPPHGSGGGIGVLAVRDDGAIVDHGLMAPVESPSYVATHPTLPVVYAACEFAQTVRAYRREGGSLVPLGGPKVAGDAVCHVAVDPGGRFLVASCWGDGRVVFYDLDAEGVIRSRRVADPARDPHGGPDRVSRAHEAVVLPDGRVLTTDLGYDLLRVWRAEPGTGLVADHDVVLPDGSGPRHAALHGSGHVYVITELSSRMCVVAPGADGRYTLVGEGPATLTAVRDGDRGAEVSVDRAGRFVHTTVRGSDRLSTLAVRDGGARLEPVDEVGCGGANPRHHLEHDGLLFVAEQDSDAVVTFRPDPETGRPGEPIASAAVGSPSCIVPL